MEPLLILGVANGILAAVLVNIAIWAPRRLWIKLAALATAACFLPVAYAGFAELLGRPKPADLQWSEGNHDEAIRLCERAEAQGWTGDWEKRIARCRKRAARAK